MSGSAVVVRRRERHVVPHLKEPVHQWVEAAGFKVLYLARKHLAAEYSLSESGDEFRG
jgi:hypothetical protein